MMVFFVFLSLLGGIAVAWYRLTAPVIAVCIAVSFFLAWRFRRAAALRIADDEERGLLNFHVLVPLFILLAALCLALLVLSTSTAALITPWQAIHPLFLPAFFLLTLCMGFLLCSSSRTKTILWMLVIYSLVQHLYLPLSHVLPWGGDVWRHMAVEERIVRGEAELPVLFGKNATARTIDLSSNRSIRLPDVFFVPQKYSYAQTWGVAALIARVFSLELLSVNRWFVPLLWPFVVSFCLFRIGQSFFRSSRSGLILAALAALPFPFQALGALTLPVSIGFMTFLFVLALWIEAIEEENTAKRTLALVFAALMAFGYSLHFLLIWFVILASWLVKRVRPIMVAVPGALLLPAIELAGHLARAPGAWSGLAQARSFLGQFSGWYFARALRPHDILPGNILFNHTPLAAAVPTFVLTWRWWAILLAAAVWGVALIGFLRSPQSRAWRTIKCVGTAVLGWYIIGWYVLEGDRLLTRRLDAVVALFVLIFFLNGMFYFASSLSYLQKPRIVYRVSLAFIFCMAFFATATFATGPDLRVVSTKEYAAAQSAWRDAEAHEPPYCVLADTWILLPMEAISAGTIVGGGFPIDYQFGQIDRVRLYQEMKREPREEILKEASAITGATECVFVP